MKKLLNLPSIVLSAFLIRLLITGASVGDSIVVLGLAGLYGTWYFLESKKEAPINDQIKVELEALKQEIRLTKDSVNGLKLISATTRR